VNVCLVVDEADSLRVNLVASCAVSSGPGDVTYVVSRPYSYDVDPASDFLWRLSTVERESRILQQMDRSDRGARRKAYRVLKALVITLLQGSGEDGTHSGMSPLSELNIEVTAVSGARPTASSRLW